MEFPLWIPACAGMTLFFCLWVLGDNLGGDAPAGAEVADYGHATGLAACRQIVENIIGQVLVEDALVAETLQVKLEGF